MSYNAINVFFPLISTTILVYVCANATDHSQAGSTELELRLPYVLKKQQPLEKDTKGVKFYTRLATKSATDTQLSGDQQLYRAQEEALPTENDVDFTTWHRLLHLPQSVPVEALDNWKYVKTPFADVAPILPNLHGTALSALCHIAAVAAVLNPTALALMLNVVLLLFGALGPLQHYTVFGNSYANAQQVFYGNNANKQLLKREV